MLTRDDVLIRVLWYIQTDTIINVKLGKAEVDNYRFESMVTLLAWWRYK